MILMSKVISYRKAADLIQDGDVVATTSFGLSHLPEQLLVGIEERYEETQSPKDLTFISSAGIGNGEPGRGLDHLLADGLVDHFIAGHLGSSPNTVAKVNENKVKCHLWPQGVFGQWYRAMGSGKPYLSKTGLQTFVDPRLEGARANEMTTEDIIDVVEVNGEEYLHYQNMDINVGLIRGSYADSKGNIAITRESSKQEGLELAMAVKNAGGKLIAQVEKIVLDGEIDPKAVYVPSGLVDHVVLAEEEKYHYQTMGTYYEPELSNEITVPLTSIEKAPLSVKKIIGRRAAQELKPGAIINLGLGTPELVGAVANEEGFDDFISTLEFGAWGGVAGSGADFGTSYNAQAMIRMVNQFDVYDGGVLDLAILGFGEIDAQGNNNATKFSGRVPGPGGFINISQNTPNLIFTGTFTVKGKSYVEDGKLVIDEQGIAPKFVNEIQQVSYSGKFASENNQNVLYITERAVFDLHEGKLRLIEIAPGLDLQEDVLDWMEFEPLVAEDLKEMDPAMFQEEWGGLLDIIENK